jgi:hypothetical protein
LAFKIWFFLCDTIFFSLPTVIHIRQELLSRYSKSHPRDPSDVWV